MGRGYPAADGATSLDSGADPVGIHGASDREETDMAKDHGPSVKDDKQYEGLRKKGMSKERAAKIANTPNASKKRRQAQRR